MLPPLGSIKMYIGISFHSLQIEVTSKAVKTVQTNMPTHMVL